MERKIRVVEVTDSYCQEVDLLGPVSSMEAAVKAVEGAGYRVRSDFDIDCADFAPEGDRNAYVVTVYPIGQPVGR